MKWLPFIGLLLLYPCDSWSQHVRVLNFNHLGPVEVPSTTSEQGTWCPNGIGWIESLEVYTSDPEIMYAGSNSGGLYRTFDGGKLWEFVLHTEPVTGVLDMVLNDSNPNELWIGTGTTVNQFPFGHGVLHSRDAGKTWFTTGLSFRPEDEMVIWALKRNPLAPGNFVALTQNSIHVSKDTCRNFEKIQLEMEGHELEFRQLLPPARSGDYWLAAGNGIWLGDQPGHNWIRTDSALSYHKLAKMGQTPPDRFALCRNPLNSRVLMALYKYAGLNYIDISSDGGLTWTNLHTGRAFSRVDRNHAEIAIDPIDTQVIYVGSVRMYRSQDRGKHFVLISQPLLGAPDFMHDDIRALTFDSRGHMYTGNDGGVSVSADRGMTWKDLSGRGLSVTQIYGMALQEAEEVKLLIGCQDLGNFIYDDEWLNIGTVYGDGGSCLFVENRRYIMQNGRLLSSSGDSQQWNILQAPFSANRLSYPLLPGTLGSDITVGDDYVYSYGNQNWQNRSRTAGRHYTKIRAMALSDQGDTTFACMAKDQPTWDTGSGLKERLYRGKFWEGGENWEDITQRLPILAWRSVSSICLDPVDKEHIWIALYGFDDEWGRYKVFESRDGGENWLNISEGLPNWGTYVLKHNKGRRNGLFLGTDGGVFYRDNRTGKWERLQGEMPAVMVRDLALTRSGKKLFIATYGNGVWQLDVPRSLRR